LLDHSLPNHVRVGTWPEVAGFI